MSPAPYQAAAFIVKAGSTRCGRPRATIAPGRPATEFETAIEKLKTGFHLHTDPKDGKLYYSPNETIEKRLSRESEMAPDNRIDDEIETRLSGAFTPTKKVAYQSVMALPEVARIATELGRERRLIVINPDSDLPPKLANDLFMNQPSKNNFIIVNGFYLALAFYGLQRFAWEFLKPYAPLVGPLTLFHLLSLAILLYAAVMLLTAPVARPLHDPAVA